MYIWDESSNFDKWSASVEFIVIPVEILDVVSNINYNCNKYMYVKWYDLSPIQLLNLILFP